VCAGVSSRFSIRIIEWFWLEGTLKVIWFQPPCHEQGHLPPAEAAQSSIQPGLEQCQGGGSHSFSGQPVPGPHHPHGGEFPPNIQSQAALFQFTALPPCPITLPVVEPHFVLFPSGCSLSLVFILFFFLRFTAKGLAWTVGAMSRN